MTRPVESFRPGASLRDMLLDIYNTAHVGLLAFEENTKAAEYAGESSREIISGLQKQVEDLQVQLNRSRKQNVSLKLVKCRRKANNIFIGWSGACASISASWYLILPQRRWGRVKHYCSFDWRNKGSDSTKVMCQLSNVCLIHLNIMELQINGRSCKEARIPYP